VTRVHRAVIYDVDTDEILDFRAHEIGKFLKIYQRATMLIGPNIIGYDIPVHAKLYGVRHSPTCEIGDTLPLARLAHSSAPAIGEAFSMACTSPPIPPSPVVR
jgi:hypothetical protein